MQRRKQFFLAGAVFAAAVGGFLAYDLYSEYEQRSLEVAMVSQADRGLYLYQFFNFGKLPTASRLVPGHSADHGFSWLVEILPYLEGANLFMKLDFNQPWDSAANAEIRSLKFTPGSGDPQKWAFRFGGGPGATESSPIVGIAGLGANAANLPMQDRQVGVFGNGRTTRLADITDGFSNTMMVATSQRLSGHWMEGGNATVRGLDPDHKPYVGATGQFGRRGGAAVLFADGSARWIPETIDNAALRITGDDPWRGIEPRSQHDPGRHSVATIDIRPGLEMIRTRRGLES